MAEIDDYHYELPAELIAQQPLPNRADARLMVVDRASGQIRHRHIRDLPDILEAGDCLVTNDTRVVQARVEGVRTKSGGWWEGLFLSVDEQGAWRMLATSRGRLLPGELLTLRDREGRDDRQLRLVAKLDGGVWLVRPEVAEDPYEMLQRVGRIPLPHYIRGGAMTDADIQSYQTMFANRPGAAAAPTAGLHFTPALLDRLVNQGVRHALVTLHVGVGTFRPIKAERLAEHDMHSEWGELTAESAERIRNCRAEGGRIVAVGTTTVRVLETAAADGELRAWQGETNLFIRPPYQFRAVDALLTNFHLPRSTLLVLVHTFGGDALLKRAYQEAIDEQYRFYSYGDAMLIV